MNLQDQFEDRDGEVVGCEIVGLEHRMIGTMIFGISK